MADEAPRNPHAPGSEAPFGAELAEQPIPSMPASEQADASELARLKQAHAELEQAKADLEAQHKRLAADFENFRRRAASEREELVKFASSRVLENLLPVVDNFERALEHMGKASDVAQVRSGVELIYRQLQDHLNKSGVSPMEAKGKPFDPNLHEAIHQQETTEVPDETVLAEVQKGYLLNGKVLRHAIVQVSRNPLGTPAAAQDPGPAAPGEHAATIDTTTQTPAAETAANKEEHHG